jgi:RNA 2',3'-cyclic 3'-phosphodiesterase
LKIERSVASMRLFLALPIPKEITHRLMHLQQRVAAKIPGARWASPDSFHVTLKFLGNTPEASLPAIRERLLQVRATPFDVEVGGLGLFLRPGIFYASVQAHRQLKSLAHKIEETMQICGFAPEDKEYRPHITIARFRGRPAEKALTVLTRENPKRIFGSFHADAFLLYRSVPSPQGSHYEVLDRFSL